VLTETLTSVADQAVATDQAPAYFTAETYAKTHPDQPFLIAIRYSEVADRFPGTEVSLRAQRPSLDAQRRSGAGTDTVGTE
jgi:hypothetical protein